MEDKVIIKQTSINGFVTTITLSDDVERIEVTFDDLHNASRIMVELREK